MATYYRWSKYQLTGQLKSIYTDKRLEIDRAYGTAKRGSATKFKYPDLFVETGITDKLNGHISEGIQYLCEWHQPWSSNKAHEECGLVEGDSGLTEAKFLVESTNTISGAHSQDGNIYAITVTKGSFFNYVYSKDQTAYPNEGQSGDYYYGDLKAVTITPPSNISVFPDPPPSWEAITVNWNQASSNGGDITEYELSMQVDGGAWDVIISDNALGITLDIEDGAETVLFRVRAKDESGYWSDYYTSKAFAVKNNTAPSTPASITIPSSISGGTSITVSWGTSTDSEGNLSGYIVERSVNGGGSWSQIYKGSARSTRNTVSFGTSSVMYRVKAYDSEGLESGYKTSNQVTVINNTAPSIPGSITVPENIIGGRTIVINWGASSDSQGNLSGYQLERSVNGGAWTSIFTGNALSHTDTISLTWDTVAYRVRAYDSYSAYSGYRSSETKTILHYVVDVLTVPEMAMEGMEIPIQWSQVSDATTYELERAINSGEWEQVFSGPDVSFTDTAQSGWSTVQYRVRAGSNGVYGDYNTGSVVNVVSKSTLVISGQDGDLGTLVNDVPYTVSTDTGNQITVRTTVNAAPIFEGNVASGTADAIPVLDLVNGDGTIVIEASVETSSGTVSAARRWTYHKDKMLFPNSGSPAELTKNGETIWPKTLAECVRIPGGRTLEEVMGFPAQIFTGSYVGTGTYGADNPTEITFPFVPDLWWIMCKKDSTGATSILDEGGPYPWGTETIWNEEGVSGNSTVNYDSTTVKIVSTASASAQRNNSGSTYYFVGIKIG